MLDATLPRLVNRVRSMLLPLLISNILRVVSWMAVQNGEGSYRSPGSYPFWATSRSEAWSTVGTWNWVPGAKHGTSAADALALVDTVARCWGRSMDINCIPCRCEECCCEENPRNIGIWYWYFHCHVCAIRVVGLARASWQWKMY